MIWRRNRDRGAGQSSEGISMPAGNKAVTASPILELEGKTQTLVNQPVNADHFPWQQSGQGAISPETSTKRGLRSYIIPSTYRVSADLFSVRPITIAGELNARELSAGQVTVLPGGVLRGISQIGRLVVAGLVDGNIKAREQIEVVSKGELRGDIQSPSLRVHPGGVVDGASLKIGR